MRHPDEVLAGGLRSISLGKAQTHTVNAGHAVTDGELTETRQTEYYIKCKLCCNHWLCFEDLGKMG